MSDRISGIIHVDKNVVLKTGETSIEVVVFPIQASVGWDFIVDRSVQVFRSYHGKHLILEGDLHGGMLASARVASEIILRKGKYHGRVESATGKVLEIHLRIDNEVNVVSADFFQEGNYFCSLRSRLQEKEGLFLAESPRYIFDSDDASSVGGRIEIKVLSSQVVQIICIIPEALPEEYSGEVSYDSEFSRVLNIEVDKLDGLPWPPEYSTDDIPSGHQPVKVEGQDISLAELFRKAGIDALVHHNDGALASTIPQSAGRPGEEDRWDEREMHEMMDTHYSRNLDAREWWLYLLIVTRFDGGPAQRKDGSFVFDNNGNIVNDGVGTTGIIFDSSTGNVRDPWISFANYFEHNAPQHKHLFDFGRSGAYSNTRARQGVAVFWREMLDFVSVDEDWYRDRQFLRTIVHELGHALNLAHAWLVNRPDTTSFMMYPQRYPHGSGYDTKKKNYWRDFDYRFDPEEIFHFKHGFYNEVIPGGNMAFMDWTPSSVFHDPKAGGTRSNISLSLEPTNRVFRFTEPVTIKSIVVNHSPEDLPIGRLSPAYGDLRFFIRKPNGNISRYQPPLSKCEIAKESLLGKEKKMHLTSLAVGADGFIFDTPGRYEITAAIPDPSSGALVVAPPASVWIRYPNQEDESIASRVFNRESSLFLYMRGGEHLVKGKDAFAEVAEKHPKHPFTAHANLVLGLNELAGQKSVVNKTVKKVNPQGAISYLKAALTSKVLPPVSQKRLEATIALCKEDQKVSKRKGRAK